jgi:predicted DNA-binding transcriptional regulator YafY
MFSTAEALGLVMAVLQGWHGTVDSDHPAAAALGKIVRVLPASAAGPAEAMRRVIAQNPGDAAASPDPELTAALARACETRGTLRIRYQLPSRPDREMVVDPWAVVVRHGRWYLLCWSRTVDARRVLRLDRITSAEPTGETGEVPADLDALRVVEDHLAEGWSYEAEVRFDVPLKEAARCVPRALGRLEPLGEHSCLLRGSTDEPSWYAAALAMTLLPFTVAGAEEVRDAVTALSARLARAAGS